MIAKDTVNEFDHVFGYAPSHRKHDKSKRASGSTKPSKKPGVTPFYGNLVKYECSGSVPNHVVSYRQFSNMIRDGSVPYPVVVQGDSKISAHPSSYLITSRLGHGGQGTVYDALMIEHDCIQCMPPCGSYLHVAIKVVVDADDANEIRYMRALSGVNGVCPLLEYGVIEHYEHPNMNHYTYFLVLPYITSVSVHDLHHHPDLLHTYIVHLLASLACLQQLGLIHHDIKQDNFLMDAEGHSFMIDFGLSCFCDHWECRCPSCHLSQVVHKDDCGYRRWMTNLLSTTGCCYPIQDIPNLEDLGMIRRKQLGYDIPVHHDPLPSVVPRMRTVQVTTHMCSGTRGFYPPEALLQWKHLTTQFDIWSAGIMVLQILCNTEQRFFYERSNDVCLKGLEELVGYDGLHDCARDIESNFPNFKRPVNYGVISSSNTDRSIQVKLLKSFIDKHANGDKVVYSENMYILLSLMLEPNPFRRVNAIEALKSKYVCEE